MNILEFGGQNRDIAGFSGDFRRLLFSNILIELHNLECFLNQHKSHIIYWNYIFGIAIKRHQSTCGYSGTICWITGKLMAIEWVLNPPVLNQSL